jgi:hypothetical protein
MAHAAKSKHDDQKNADAEMHAWGWIISAFLGDADMIQGPERPRSPVLSMIPSKAELLQVHLVDACVRKQERATSDGHEGPQVRLALPHPYASSSQSFSRGGPECGFRNARRARDHRAIRCCRRAKSRVHGRWPDQGLCHQPALSP